MNPNKNNPLESFIVSGKQKLVKTIAALQSDEVIQQMRNDKTLYQYKLTHITEIIEDHFNFQKEIVDIVSENQQLRDTLASVEDRLKRKDEEFNEAIDMIEESAKKLTQLKDQQINGLKNKVRDLEVRYSSKEDVNDKAGRKVGQLSQQVSLLQQERDRLKKQITKLRDEGNKMNELNKKLKMGQKECENDRDRSVTTLKTEHQRQIQEYDILVRKMQNDMLIIKSQWQKKCMDVEKGLRQFYEGQMMKLEEKKTREMIQHIEGMKQGKPVIIKQDEEILTSRIESVRRQYENQIQKLKKNKSELQEMYQNLQNAHIPKVKQIQTLAEALKAVRNQFQIQKQNWAAEKDRSKRQTQKLKSIVLEFERNSKDVILSSESKEAQIVKLHDNIKFIEKKLQIANRGTNEAKSLLASKEDQLEALKAKCQSLQEVNKKFKKNLQSAEVQLQTKTKKIQGVTKQLETLAQKLKQQKQNRSELRSQIKSLKASKQKFRKTFDRLSIQLKQYQKQLLLLKQDIKYGHEVQRKKNSADFDKLVAQIEAYKQNTQKDNKGRMNDLINEIEEAKEAQHIQFEKILRQRQNLKRQVAELQQLFDKKQREVEQTKRSITNAQADEIKRTMLQQLQRQRLKYQRLQQQLLQKQKQYHRRLQRTKSEVKQAIRVLANKWMEEMSRLEDDNKRKQHQMQRIVEKVQIVISQSQEMKISYQSEKEENRRLKKKYETVKQEKDEQIADIIKRLERQSKHKISLQKQLRSIRSELNRNDKYPAAERYVLESEGKNAGNTSVTDRQKEITQIRELIAKTYHAVGEKPEKDTKFQRQRSPF